jgi:hypothetical protein
VLPAFIQLLLLLRRPVEDEEEEDTKSEDRDNYAFLLK